MKKSIIALAAIAFVLTGPAMAGEVKGPAVMSDSQLDQMVAGRLMNVYINTETNEWVLKPASGPGNVDHTPGFEGNGNWVYQEFTCETAGGGCSAYEGPVAP